MDLHEHYRSLYEASVIKIGSDKYETDHLMDSESDTRRGITLIIRPDKLILENIDSFLSKLKLIEPEQYYHPGPDLHVTVLAIISCYQDFLLQNICPNDYIGIIQECLQEIKNIKIHFKGVTASPSCILIQGFPVDDNLNLIRNRLREKFKASPLQQSIDSRYALQTAHLTVVRFREPFTDKARLIKTLNEYQDFDFGTLCTSSIEFVYNDWYQRREIVQQLHRFEL